MWQNVYNTTMSWATALGNGVRSIFSTISTPGAMYGLPPVSGYQPAQTTASRQVFQREVRNAVFYELDRVITPIARGGR
jgi:hypothetical protein